MDKKIVIFISIALAISAVANGYQYITLIQTQTDASAQISTLEIEIDSLNNQLTTVTTQRDDALTEVATVSSERDSLQSENDDLTDEVSSLTNERNNLLGQVDSLADERDAALGSVANLENQIDALENEVETLQNEIVWEFGDGGWQTAQDDGSYEVQQILTLYSSDSQINPYNYVDVYQELESSNGILISFDVRADQLGAFALILAENTPFFGTTDGINFEMGAPQLEGKGFQISRWASSWTWNTFAQPEEGVWYTVQISAQKDPFEVTYTVYQGTQLVGSTTANDMTNLSFDDLHYVVFSCWAGVCQYHIKDFNIEYS